MLIAISILSVVIYFFIRPTNRLSDDKVTKNSIYESDPRSSLTIAEVFFEIFKILLSQGELITLAITISRLQLTVSAQEDTLRKTETLFTFLRVLGVWEPWSLFVLTTAF